MFCSHVSWGLLVSGLCVLTVTGSARVWQFYAMAAACGLADAFCRPASVVSCHSRCSRATCLPPTPCWPGRAGGDVCRAAAGRCRDERILAVSCPGSQRGDILHRDRRQPRAPAVSARQNSGGPPAACCRASPRACPSSRRGQCAPCWSSCPPRRRPIAGDFGEDVGGIDEAGPFGCPRDLIGGLCKGERGRARAAPGSWRAAMGGFSGAGIPRGAARNGLIGARPYIPFSCDCLPRCRRSCVVGRPGCGRDSGRAACRGHG